MNLTTRTHLLQLCVARRFEILQALRLARMSLPAGSPSIAGLLDEQRVNDAAIAALEASFLPVAA